MPKIFIADHHDQVYSVWKEHGARNLKVSHVDFHCDMRGLLIDRPKGEAYFASRRESTFVDGGNFLGHAIMERIVSDLRWVHCDKSGRRFDKGSVVAYESDVLAPWYNFRHRRSNGGSVSIDYKECLLSEWEGLRPDEQLDLDWDALASIEIDRHQREKMIGDFLAMDLKNTPEVTFLIYSPGYSDPDRSLYEDFARELAGKFGAEIVRLPEAEYVADGERFSALRGAVKRLLPQQLLASRHAVTGWWRHYQTKGDLSFYNR